MILVVLWYSQSTSCRTSCRNCANAPTFCYFADAQIQR